MSVFRNDIRLFLDELSGDSAFAVQTDEINAVAKVGDIDLEIIVGDVGAIDNLSERVDDLNIAEVFSMDVQHCTGRTRVDADETGLVLVNIVEYDGMNRDIEDVDAVVEVVGVEVQFAGTDGTKVTGSEGDGDLFRTVGGEGALCGGRDAHPRGDGGTAHIACNGPVVGE